MSAFLFRSRHRSSAAAGRLLSTSNALAIRHQPANKLNSSLSNVPYFDDGGRMASLRELHRERRPLISPLAHDALSARLIERAGFKTFNIGGSAMLAARHALPDLGLAGFAEMLAGIRDIVEASPLPCLVDADDGYGDVKSVVRTIRAYEAAGVSGVLLEDQSRESKQPGAASARSVVPLEVMEQKLKAAMEARQDSDFVIIGRTDAYGAEGLDAALKRAERFLRLGADGIFVAGLKTPQDYAQVGKAFKDNWNCAAIFEAATTPWFAPAELYSMGFSQVAYPNILIGRVAKAIEHGLQRLGQLAAGKDTAFTNGDQEMALKSLADALDLQKWNDLEKKYL
jgi:2-methylisocitrate lyase-like PEP mutase family enzyme